jgi:hypothetical protein
VIEIVTTYAKELGISFTEVTIREPKREIPFIQEQLLEEYGIQFS